MKQLIIGFSGLLLPFFLTAQKDCPNPILENTGQLIVVKQGNSTTPLWKGDVNGLIPNPATVSTSNPAFTFSLEDKKITVPNKNCKDTTCNECGWYKAFWIFGDGNYRKFKDDINGMDVESHTANYTYSKQAIYEPVLYLTERYHNDKKPNAARISINVTGSPSTPGSDEPVLLNQQTTRAAIDFNNEMRKGYPTVFALAHLSNDNVTRALFFYNSLEQDGRFVRAHVMDYERTEYPSYYGRSNSVKEQVYQLDKPDFSSKFSSNFFDILSQKFLNCQEYNYDNLQINPESYSGQKEFRLFPVVNTVKFGVGEIPRSPTVLVSVILGSKPLIGDTLSSVYSQVRALFNENDDLTLDSSTLFVYTNGIENSEYIRGVSMLKLPVLASHDPNNLFVTKIDTLPAGKFRAYFSLRICNKGEMEERSPTLSFQDLTAGHYSSKPVLIDMPADVTLKNERTEIGNYSVTLDKFIIRGVPPDYAPACKFVHFSIETDEAGILQLYKESPRALRVCVSFSSAVGDKPECSENDVLKPGDLDPDPIIPTGNNDCWLLFFLALLILILIIYAWKNNQQDS